MVEQATHNRQATGSNPVGANTFLARFLVVVSVATSLAAQSLPLYAQGADAGLNLKGPIPQSTSTVTAPDGSLRTGTVVSPGGTGSTTTISGPDGITTGPVISPSGNVTTGTLGSPGSFAPANTVGPGTTATPGSFAPVTPLPSATVPSNAADVVTNRTQQNPANAPGSPGFPIIPPLQLISPPAVPPTLPPSYYEEGNSGSPLKPAPATVSTPVMGPRLQPNEPLKASVVKSGISAAAGQLTGPLPSGRKLDVTVVVLSVRNNTTAPIIVDGDTAIISSSGAPLQALPEYIVVKRTHPFFTTSQKIQLGIITVATLGLATVIAGERMTNKTSPSARFGVYETMRRIEDVRFGRRVVLPGEETRGLVFFDESVQPTGSMSIPLRTFPANDSYGRLSVDIVGSTNLQ